MFLDMAAKYDINLHIRKVRKSSLSFIMPHDGKRAIVRCRDDDYLRPFRCSISPAAGRCISTAIRPTRRCIYAKQCREAGILTSLDGGGLRTNTHELLAFIDVAMVAERFCEQMHLTPAATLDYLKSRGCRIGGVTLGERGLLWYDETGAVRTNSALPVPADRVIDTSGAGDVFHGAYVYSYLTDPTRQLGRPLRLRPGRRHLQDPAPRQRGRPADGGRHRRRAEGVRPRGGVRPSAGRGCQNTKCLILRGFSGSFCQNAEPFRYYNTTKPRICLEQPFMNAGVVPQERGPASPR